MNVFIYVYLCWYLNNEQLARRFEPYAQVMRVDCDDRYVECVYLCLQFFQQLRVRIHFT